MLVGDKTHTNSERKENSCGHPQVVLSLHGNCNESTAVSVGNIQAGILNEWSAKLDTQWGVVRWVERQAIKVRRSCLNWLQWKVLSSQAKSGLDNYSLCPSLETIHFHEERLSDGRISIFIFPMVVLCGLFIIYIFLAAAVWWTPYFCSYRCVCGSRA